MDNINKPVLENLMQCPLCGGTVDKYNFHIECRDCHAYGDLLTFIMQESDEVVMKKFNKSIRNT